MPRHASIGVIPLRLLPVRSRVALAGGVVLACTAVVGAALVGVAATPVTALADGARYTLASEASGQCLDVPGAATTTGLQLQQWGCATSDWQTFTARRTSAGTWTLASVATGQCVDVTGGRRTSGTPVVQWPCGGAAWQSWTPEPVGTALRLRNASTGTCLAVDGTGSGARTVAVSCADAPAQRWTVTTVGGTAGARSSTASTASAAATAPTATTASASASPAGRVIRVAADGSGDARTLQAAIDAVPDGGAVPYTVLLARGTYRGQVTVPASKRRLTLQGATGAPSDVVLTAGVSSNSVGSLAGSATLTVTGSDVTVRDLTVENTYDESAGGSPALALHSAGDRQVYRDVRLLGNQDTFLADGRGATQNRVYVVDSYIAGDVDFVFGSSAVVIDRSTIHTLARGGAVLAPSTATKHSHGILVTGSTLTGDARTGSTELGRPWHAGGAGNDVVLPRAVVRDSVLGAHVRTAQPWADMSGFSWRTDASFAEYRNTGPGAGTNANRPQLTAAQAAQHTPKTYLAGGDGWDPTAAATPSTTTSAGGSATTAPASATSAAGPATGTAPASGGTGAARSWPSVADGFASLDAMGQKGTTGGAGGRTVTVSTQAALEQYVTAAEPYVIRVKGAITITPKGTELRVASDKTIIGVGTDGQIVQGGFFLGQGVHNVIIRNLTIRDSYVEGDPGGKCCDWDAIQMDGAHHVWIDHNRLSHMNDGLIDSRKDTTYLTVSYNVLENHNKAFGIGWTPNTTARITIHHNIFRKTQQRNPSIDNVAYAHLYNNYLVGVSAYGNNVRGKTRAVIENSYYDGVTDPYFIDSVGELRATGNIDVNSRWTTTKRSGGAAFDPRSFYPYTLDAAADLPVRLPALAGPLASVG